MQVTDRSNAPPVGVGSGVVFVVSLGGSAGWLVVGVEDGVDPDDV